MLDENQTKLSENERKNIVVRRDCERASQKAETLEKRVQVLEETIANATESLKVLPPLTLYIRGGFFWRKHIPKVSGSRSRIMLPAKPWATRNISQFLQKKWLNFLKSVLVMIES